MDTVTKQSTESGSDEGYWHRVQLSRRLRLATKLELAFTAFIVFAVATRYMVYDSRSDPFQRFAEIIYNPPAVLCSLLLFAQMFVWTLTGKTIAVGIVVSKFRLYSSLDTTPTSVSSADPVIDEFNKIIDRSAQALRVAQRRPNALLMVGTTVAMAGLVFFILTLPTFGIIKSAGQISAVSPTLEGKLLELVPRLLMLIFIQVLAGFFLRQYRLSMEELKYFEAILRTRETQLLCYRILSTAEGERLPDFATSLMVDRDRDLLRLQQGETTVTLEAQKLEMNEFKGIYDKLFDIVKSPLEKRAGGVQTAE